MRVRELIKELMKIEDKDKNIFYTDGENWWDVDILEGEHAVYLFEEE